MRTYTFFTYVSNARIASKIHRRNRRLDDLAARHGVRALLLGGRLPPSRRGGGRAHGEPGAALRNFPQRDAIRRLIRLRFAGEIFRAQSAFLLPRQKVRAA